jgi:hypothetical protein
MTEPERDPWGPNGDGLVAGRRGPTGRGSVSLQRDGRYAAKIYLRDHRRVVWMRHTREEAEAALPEMVEKYRMEVGASYYRYYIAYVHGDPRRVRPPRSGVTTRVRFDVFQRDGFRCVYCGSTDELVVDHIKPVADGGSDDQDNLATACRPCNEGKGGRPLTTLPPALQR